MSGNGLYTELDQCRYDQRGDGDIHSRSGNAHTQYNC